MTSPTYHSKEGQEHKEGNRPKSTMGCLKLVRLLLPPHQSQRPNGVWDPSPN